MIHETIEKRSASEVADKAKIKMRIGETMYEADPLSICEGWVWMDLALEVIQLLEGDGIQIGENGGIDLAAARRIFRHAPRILKLVADFLRTDFNSLEKSLSISSKNPLEEITAAFNQCLEILKPFPAAAPMRTEASQGGE